MTDSIKQQQQQQNKDFLSLSLSAAHSILDTRIARTSSQRAKIPSTVTKTGKKELKLLFKECFEHCCTSVEKPFKSPWI